MVSPSSLNKHLFKYQTGFTLEMIFKALQNIPICAFKMIKLKYIGMLIVFIEIL